MKSRDSRPEERAAGVTSKDSADSCSGCCEHFTGCAEVTAGGLLDSFERSAMRVISDRCQCKIAGICEGKRADTVELKP